MKQNAVSSAEYAGGPIYFGQMPVDTKCPFCGHRGYTLVEFESGNLTCLVLCLFFFVLSCFAFILCCIQGLKKPVHYCAKCHSVIGMGQDPVCP